MPVKSAQSVSSMGMSVKAFALRLTEPEPDSRSRASPDERASDSPSVLNLGAKPPSGV